jgi:hypothetical protein
MLYEKVIEDAPGPQRIVFDLQGLQPFFAKSTAWMVECEADLTEVMHLLPAYINESTCARDGLNALAEMMITNHDQAGARHDGEIYAKAIHVIGEYMIDQYVQQGLYRHDGVCRYVFEGWLDRHSPVFVKTTLEELFEC